MRNPVSRLLCLMALATLAIFAQTATLTGRITDASGAAVPNAKVSITAVASGVEQSVETSDQGFYNVPSLQPGRYNVSVTKAGFQTVRSANLELAVQQVARLDLNLPVGQLAETIEVKAQSIVLETDTSTTGQVIQSKQITDLPLLGRNTYALAMLVPGVRPSVGVNNLVVDQISTVAYAINGQRAAANEFLLDGAPNSAPSQNQPVINANPDAVQEFKVETNSFSAEYGRAAGGVFNVVTRSGGNSFHGSLYEFLRNDKLNANDFFANAGRQPAPPFKFNQFGGTLGGPVNIPKLYNGHKRTFFFVSVESVRFIQGMTFVGTTPRAPELSGDFSAIKTAAGAAINIYDPLTTTANPAGGSIRQLFPGNIIPSNRISPIARNVSKFFPTPTSAGINAFTGANNYVRTSGNVVNKDTVSYRVDHYFNEGNRFFARYSADDSPFIRAAPYGADNPASPGTGPQTFGRRNTVIEDTNTFSPTLLMTVRASYTRLSNKRSAFSEPFDISTLGFPQSLGPQLVPRAFPNFGVTGYNVTGSIPNIVVGGSLGATDVIRLGNDTFSGQANISKSLTRHTLKAGFEYRSIRFNNLQTGANTPVFAFNTGFTQGPNPAQSSATAGHALASFLLGTPASGSVTPSPAVANQTLYYGAYLQDNYKVSTKLTLNLGVRWEMETPRTDRFNQLTNFDYAAKSPLNIPGLNLLGGLTFVGTGGLPRTNSKYDKNNFAPRFGFSYQATPKTVIRGGTGLFYSSITGIGSGPAAFGISGFQTSTTMVTSNDGGFTPFNTLSNPYPQGLLQASGSSQGLATLLGQGITFTDRGTVTPYAVQWNFNIQRELPKSILVELGYVGTHGLKFPSNLTLNQLPDSALALKDDLRTSVTNPFFGQIPSGILAQRTVVRAQLLRPYPQYDGVTSANATWASSIFHGLTMKAEKRYANGLTVLGSYTYSKAMDYGIGAFAGESTGGAGYQNWNNLRAERSISELDQTHRFTFNVVYELPFFKSGHGFAGKLLGGWQVGGILVAYSGDPLGIGAANNNTFSQGGGQRPNWTGVSAKLDNPTPQRWFDTSQFTQPAPYTFGNAGRSYSGLRSDAARQLDASLVKNTKLLERLNLQFRAEAFNLSNTPRFAPPNISFGNAQFGVVSSMQNQSRVVQLALKLIF